MPTPDHSSSPLLAHAPVDEEAVVRAIVAARPAVVLVASDLHLGPGQDPATGLYHRGENFFADDAFARWLRAHGEAGSSRLLVLGGDLLDFTRLDECPAGAAALDDWSARLARVGRSVTADQLARTLSRSDRLFGLRTHDVKSVWKLARMLEGHRGLVAALARWVRAGHTVILLKGNHDLELHWPLVRLAFRDALLRELGDTPDALAAVTTRLAFALDGFDLANVRFEHGHQYEGLTRVRGEATLGPDHQELRYPLGSFLNRYVVNGFERLSPFLDNIKPVDRAVLALVKKHPLQTVKNYVRAWRFVWKALRLGGPPLPVIAITAGLVIPPLVALAVAFFLAVPSAWRAVQQALPFLRGNGAEAAFGGSALGLLYPYLLSALIELLHALKILRPRDHLGEAAAAHLKSGGGGAVPASLPRPGPHPRADGGAGGGRHGRRLLPQLRHLDPGVGRGPPGSRGARDLQLHPPRPRRRRVPASHAGMGRPGRRGARGAPARRAGALGGKAWRQRW